MAEPYVIKMPQLSDTMTEGVIVSWEKQPGDKIERGDVVATVETDKAVMDVEVFREGYLSGPLAPEGATVPVGEPIAYLVPEAGQVRPAEAEQPPDGAPAPSNGGAAPDQTQTSPPSQAAASAEETASTTEDAGGETGAGADQPPPGATYTIKMPQLSDTMTEGVIVSWEKQPGDKIERGDVVATVETDKAVMDVEVFREGYLSGPLAPEGATVPVGEPIAYLVAEADQVVGGERRTAAASKAADSGKKAEPAAAVRPAPAQKPPAPHVTTGPVQPAPRPDNKQATPYARKLAAERHVNLNTLKGTGPDGVITAADVLAAQPLERPTEVARPTPAHALPEVQVPGHGRPMTAMERAVSHSMTASLTMPTFHVMVRARPDAIIRAAKKKGVSVTVAIAKACAEAMKKHPRMNWAYQPVDKLVEREQIDIGMAVATEDGGLVVPVLRQCESRSLEELHQAWQDLVERARKRRLAPEEYANPTFMISNMGMLGVDYFDAIPTPGTAAILAIATAGPEGMPLTITADHRVVNGAEVALFLSDLKQTLENPESWMGPIGPAIPEGNWDYDVVVIGGGPGGEDCARELAEHGLKVAMINDAPLPGGECLWRGCIPSKTWRAAADRIRDRVHDAHLGILGTTEPRLDWDKLQQTRRDVLTTRGEMAAKTDKGIKIKLIQGFASFESDHRIFVDTSRNIDDPFARPQPGDGSQGEHITFGAAVIATGAPPFVPPIPGAHEGLESGGVLTSDTIWNLESRPQRMAIVGGGAIGMEMAQIFQDFGTTVALFEGRDRVLAEVEPEIAKQLTAILERDPNLSLHTAVKVLEVRGAPGDMTLIYQDSDGQQHEFPCDYVLMATGKRPVLEPLALDKAGVKVENGVIPVDARCRTNIPHIFAVGDVNGGLMLAHTAGHQGRVAAANLMGEDARYDQDKDCGVIFTRPQAAFVGLSLEQAKAKGIDAVEVKVPMAIDAKAMITGETEGMIKLVADKASERIIGVHFLADHADTLIGEAVAIISSGLTLAQVGSAIHPHPTQTELFGDLARRLRSRLRRMKARRK